MDIAPFATESFFARYEFTTPFLLCASDVETMTVGELLRLGGQTPDLLLDARLGYTDSQGSFPLRAAIAELYERAGPEQVVVLNAPEEGIFLAMQALLKPGDHVVALAPAYDSLINLAEHLSGNVSRWAVVPREAGWELDVEALARLVTTDTRLIVVNFPHNPTGLLPTADEFAAIIDIARTRGAWFFCDEMYRGLEPNPGHQLRSACDLYDRAIVLAGLSKTHGLPGLRAGWLVIPDTGIREAIINWKYYTTICSPVPSEVLAVVAIKAHEILLERSRAVITSNVALAEAFFGRWTDLFRWHPPQAGSVALVGLNVPSAADYCHTLARDAGVLLLPGTSLGLDDHSVRFGFGRTSFAVALGQLEAYLEAQP